MSRPADPERAGSAGSAAEAQPADSDRPALASAAGLAASRRQLRLTSRGVELLTALGALLLSALVCGYRVSVAHTARYPGHADPAFTYGVAENIAAGRGPDIDYVWHFLAPGTPLHHYAFDYWLPLPSQLMALVLRHRPGLPAALELNVALIVLMCAGAYALTRALTDAPWAPAVSAAAALVQPVVSAYAMQAESAIYLGAFALPAMAAAIYARRWTALWAVAGAFAGLAAMSRSEGLLLCVVLGAAALLWHEHSRTYLRAGLLLAGYLVVSAPYLLTNLSHFGSPMPPAAASFPFISSYEDLFAPRVRRSPGALFEGGLGRFFEIRGHLIDLQLEAAFAAMAPIVSVLVLLLIGSMAARSLAARRDARQAESSRPGRLRLDAALPVLRSDWLAPVGFLLVAFLLNTLVAPAVAEGGAIVKVMITGVPILLVLAVVGLSRLRLHPALTAICCLALIGYPLTSVAHHSRATIGHNNGIGRAAAALAAPLTAEAACLGRPVVLMTRQPWEVNQATGVATVALPTGSLAEILEVAQRYGVTDIENPAVRLDAATVARALAADGPLARSAAFASRKIYRIRAATSDARC
ncbi:MAG: hypothetical protein ABIQ09_11385 [Jatrophihabitantaceae bacterium]